MLTKLMKLNSKMNSCPLNITLLNSYHKSLKNTGNLPIIEVSMGQLTIF